MNKWYSQPQAAKYRRLVSLGRLLAWLCAGLSLAACIFLCTRVRTGNANRMLGWVVGISTLGGWLFMLLTVFLIRPAKAQAEHILGLLGDAERSYTGQLTVAPDRILIPGSIVVRKVQLQTGEETLHLSLNDRLAGQLPPAGQPVRVRVVRSFIIGVEVCAHEDA